MALRNVVRALVLAVVLSVVVGAHAQGVFPPSRVSNLQVLAPSSEPQEVIRVMREMTRGLGVRCQFCHVGKEGQALDQFDFVSDTPPNKQRARDMMRLAASVNSQLGLEGPKAAPGARVTCYTCHRGAERPVHAPEIAKPGARAVTKGWRGTPTRR